LQGDSVCPLAKGEQVKKQKDIAMHIHDVEGFLMIKYFNGLKN
jgi:hypothetical protein